MTAAGARPHLLERVGTLSRWKRAVQDHRGKLGRELGVGVANFASAADATHASHQQMVKAVLQVSPQPSQRLFGDRAIRVTEVDHGRVVDAREVAVALRLAQRELVDDAPTQPLAVLAKGGGGELDDALVGKQVTQLPPARCCHMVGFVDEQRVALTYQRTDGLRVRCVERRRGCDDHVALLSPRTGAHRGRKSVSKSSHDGARRCCRDDAGLLQDTELFELRGDLLAKSIGRDDDEQPRQSSSHQKRDHRLRLAGARRHHDRCGVRDARRPVAEHRVDRPSLRTPQPQPAGLPVLQLKYERVAPTAANLSARWEVECADPSTVLITRQQGEVADSGSRHAERALTFGQAGRRSTQAKLSAVVAEGAQPALGVTDDLRTNGPSD